MIKAKLLAMCVCPALLAPPTILAVHKPARHAVAHLLHRAAERLDHAASAPVAVAAVDCLPVVASGGGAGLPVIGPVGSNEILASNVGPISGDTGSGFLPVAFGSGSGSFAGGGFGGGGGSGGGGTPGTPGGGGSVTPPITPPVPPVSPGGGGNGSGGSASSGTPEPAAWLLMLTGFGAVGTAIRYQRVTPITRINTAQASYVK